MPPREIAARRLAQRASRFPELFPGDTDPLTAREAAPPDSDQRDVALAGAIEFTALSRWNSLVALLRPALSRPWQTLDHEVRGALLAGAAQIFLLDRIPDHAAIDETVEAVRRIGRPRAAGLVNAVLRRVMDVRAERVESAGLPPWSRDLLPLADGTAWRLRRPVFAEAPLERLAEQASLAPALASHWALAFGLERAHRLCAHAITTAPIILAATGPWPPLAALVPHATTGFAVFTGGAGDLAPLLHAHPHLRVQDPASARPVTALAAHAPPARIRVAVDACAGRGTKTRQLRAAYPDATIIASDSNSDRLIDLRAAFEGDEQVVVLRPSELERFAGRADVLLLDVPCSNTGVLPRRAEARYRFGDRTLRTLTRMQQQIAAATIPLLGNDGLLLYATCSMAPAENEEAAKTISVALRGRILHDEAIDPSGLPGEPGVGYRDGGYLALIGRA